MGRGEQRPVQSVLGEFSTAPTLLEFLKHELPPCYVIEIPAMLVVVFVGTVWSDSSIGGRKSRKNIQSHTDPKSYLKWERK